MSQCVTPCWDARANRKAENCAVRSCTKKLVYIDPRLNDRVAWHSPWVLMVRKKGWQVDMFILENLKSSMDQFWVNIRQGPGGLYTQAVTKTTREKRSRMGVTRL